MIRRVVGAALGSGLSRVVLVVGSEGRDLVNALGALTSSDRLAIVTNRDPSSGMSSSLRVGLEAVEKDFGGVMVLLGDQPFLTSGVIDLLLGSFRGDPTKIVAPRVNVRRSNPVIFPAELVPELAEAQGDVGGRVVIRRHEERLVCVALDNEYDDADVDTPEDLARVRGGIEF